MSLYLCKWSGGTKGNVIPAKSFIKFGIKKQLKTQFLSSIDREIANVYNYYKKYEPNIEIRWNSSHQEQYLSEDNTKLILSTSHVIPHGVIKNSSIYKGFVETSNNFAIVKTEGKEIIFWLYPRSIIRNELDSFCLSMLQLGELGDWDIFMRTVLPEWLPDPNSAFLVYVKEIYQKLHGKRVSTQIVHGGLETGMISQKLPGIQIVSLGPRMEGNHSPNERLNISDVATIYNVLIKIVTDLENLN